MKRRNLYLLDEQTGRVIRHWPIDGMDALQVTELERKILIDCGEGVLLRDSAFDDAQ
ncbi:hypothetical protein [Novosphingobium sp.]|uniref:hypothetical protein n=1 Tax=Novosphingobium sp. TaxID=1874826 RepID=UPI002FDE7572